ncbi:MAG: family 16 glycoside hydrolase [Alphaproteobacteria bacterium]
MAKSKFAAWPPYGQAMRGHIGLQDHGDVVEFKNIRIRELSR